MNRNFSPQHAQNCERWLADAALIKWLRDTSDAALKQMGDMIDTTAMVRAQGVYKAVEGLIQEIEGGAKYVETLRINVERTGIRDETSGFNLIR